MTKFILAFIAPLWLALLLSANAIGFELNGDLKAFLASRESEFNKIPDDRKDRLKQLSDYISKCRAIGEPAKLTFICTHNSRRSHMSQLWASAAAAYYGISVETFSGGTEATAFNPRAINALKEAGFVVDALDRTSNPKYKITLSDSMNPIICFSKVYSEEPNPKTNFCAVLTCSSADKECPTVRGAKARIAVPYEDPKVADDTPGEAAKYSERSAQIAREMLFVFSQVK